MARPREFNLDLVLDRSVHIFWQHGYSDTSLDMLLKGMGIARASLYAAFGDKRGLFILTLRRYVDRYLMPDYAPRRNEGTQQAIRRILTTATPGGRRRCLLSDTCANPIAHDPEVAQELAIAFQRMEDAIALLLRKGQKDGTVPATVKPRKQARNLLAALQGMHVLASVREDARTFTDIIECALDGLFTNYGLNGPQ